MTERDRAQPRYAGEVLRAQDKHVQIVSQNKHFTYDHVFGNDTHQGDIFTALGERPVQKFVEGETILSCPLLFFFNFYIPPRL